MIKYIKPKKFNFEKRKKKVGQTQKKNKFQSHIQTTIFLHSLGWTLLNIWEISQTWDFWTQSLDT